jgi:hypothetical protein
MDGWAILCSLYSMMSTAKLYHLSFVHALSSNNAAAALSMLLLPCNNAALSSNNAAYKHGTSVDVFESASERRGADGIDARA